MNTQLNFWVGIIIYLVVILSLVYIFNRFYRFFFRSKHIFGDRLESRITGLAITSLFFGKAVVTLFITPMRIIYFALLELYNALSNAIDFSNGKSLKNGANVQDSINRLLSNLYNDIPFFSVTDVFLALAFWIFCGQLINSYMNAGGREESSGKIMGNTVRQKVILGILFLMSIYLSFASIITVPYFTENDHVEVSKDLLKGKLDATKESFKNYTIALEKTAPGNNFDSLFPVRVASLHNQHIKDIVREIYDDIETSYNNNIASRQKASGMMANINRDMLKDVVELYDKLQGQYQVEEPNLKSRQKLSYINSLADYYNERVKSSVERANDVLRAVDEGDNNLSLAMRNFNIDFSNLLAQAALADTGKTATDNFNLDYSLRLSMRNYYEALSFLDYNSNVKYNREAPLPPAAGDELGIFKNISQWLIKPHSMSLVLITGMLGFGLFGAAISTFVRESRKAKGFMNIEVVDITGIVVKGISAAIVIFLAVKGGLAVFSSGDADPNPYALFFTCLVGAVYSEKIWKWAQDKLLQNFGNEKEEEKKAALEKEDGNNKGVVKTDAEKKV